MNDDQFEDLKQLIVTTVNQAVSQAVAEAERRINGHTDSRIDALQQELNDMRQEMREGFAGVGDAFAPANGQIEDHEQRIAKLEQQAA